MPELYARGAQINSALYIVLLFVAGTLRHEPIAWVGAIGCAGVTYLGYLLQFTGEMPEVGAVAARKLRIAASWCCLVAIGVGLVGYAALLLGLF